MVARKFRHHLSLARGRLTTSSNIQNIYNFYKYYPDRVRLNTMYQQLFYAKRDLRAYHGEHITEKRFKNEWIPQLNSVSKIDSENDIKTISGLIAKNDVKMTPYQMQTFAFLEKRLDFAVFRAMMATSIREARMMIIASGVTVNDKYIKDAGYKLQPGDIVKCDPERVLRFMGTEKPNIKESLKVDAIQVSEWREEVAALKKDPSGYFPQFKFKIDGLYEREPKRIFIESLFKEGFKKQQKQQYDLRKQNDDVSIVAKILRVLETDGPSLAKFKENFVSSDELGNKAQALYNKYISNIDLTKFGVIVSDGTIKSVQETTPEKKTEKIETISHEDIIKSEEKAHASSEDGIVSKYLEFSTQLLKDSNNELVRKLKDELVEFKVAYGKEIEKNRGVDKINMDWVDSLVEHEVLPEEFKEESFADLEEADLVTKEKELSEHVKLPWQTGYLYGRQKPEATYFSPWKPRGFLGVFAIAPFHLEINWNTCQFVYLRDPICRPGHSEVISPFGLDTHEKAYLYYKRMLKNKKIRNQGFD
ncbi:hypothetical protein QEN19_004314 [Hanseniaspora menglaensis]